MITAVELSRHILAKSRDKALETKATNYSHYNLSKLVKMVYIVNGLYLFQTGESLFEENIQAWKHGPVAPSVYYTFRKYPSALNQIIETDNLAEEIDLDRYAQEINNEETQSNSKSGYFNKEAFELSLDVAIKFFANKTSAFLENWTHRKGSAWSKVYNKDERNTIIEFKDIEKEFTDFFESFENNQDKES